MNKASVEVVGFTKTMMVTGKDSPDCTLVQFRVKSANGMHTVMIDATKLHAADKAALRHIAEAVDEALCDTYRAGMNQAQSDMRRMLGLDR